jgi:exopolysaccharide production protein ExoZ
MIRPIQYLRGIAAMMVVWVHAVPIVPAVAAQMGDPQWGTAGVDLFFVISGFIMVVSTADKPVTSWQFICHRIARVVPLYWLVTLVMVAKAASRHQLTELHYTGAAIAKSLTFIPYDSLEHPGRVWPILLQGWTLNYEMFFYALFALSLALPKWRLQAMLGALSLLVISGFVFEHSGPLSSVYVSPILLEFGLGMWLAQDWVKGRLSERSIFVSVAMIVLGFWLLMHIDSRWSLTFGALLVVAGAMNSRICGVHNRLLMELGNASYSIYLTHIFMFGTLRAIGRHLSAHVSLSTAAAFMFVAMTICAIAGWLCYRFVEKPMTDFFHGRMKHRASALVAAPQSP